MRELLIRGQLNLKFLGQDEASGVNIRSGLVRSQYKRASLYVRIQSSKGLTLNMKHVCSSRVTSFYVCFAGIFHPYLISFLIFYSDFPSSFPILIFLFLVPISSVLLFHILPLLFLFVLLPFLVILHLLILLIAPFLVLLLPVFIFLILNSGLTFNLLWTFESCTISASLKSVTYM